MITICASSVPHLQLWQSHRYILSYTFPVFTAFAVESSATAFVLRFHFRATSSLSSEWHNCLWIAGCDVPAALHLKLMGTLIWKPFRLCITPSIRITYPYGGFASQITSLSCVIIALITPGPVKGVRLFPDRGGKIINFCNLGGRRADYNWFQMSLFNDSPGKTGSMAERLREGARNE